MCKVPKPEKFKRLSLGSSSESHLNFYLPPVPLLMKIFHHVIEKEGSKSKNKKVMAKMLQYPHTCFCLFLNI